MVQFVLDLVTQILGNAWRLLLEFLMMASQPQGQLHRNKCEVAVIFHMFETFAQKSTAHRGLQTKR